MSEQELPSYLSCALEMEVEGLVQQDPDPENKISCKVNTEYEIEVCREGAVLQVIYEIATQKYAHI